MATNPQRLATFTQHPGDCKRDRTFECKSCDFKSSQKCHLIRHFKTEKHKRMVEGIKGIKGIKGDENGIIKTTGHLCSFCNRSFQSRSGKWRHEKKCAVREARAQHQNEVQKLKQEADQVKQKLAVLTAVNEALQKTQTINNNIKMRDQNNTTVNNITINCFLNDKCKNAPDVMEFIKNNIQFTLANIDPDRPNSTIEALGDMMVEACKAGDSTMRPIHCSDEKRQTFYVKDASGWAKDIDNKKIDKAIGWANMRHQATWHEKAKKEGLAKATNDTDYLKTNVAMGTWSDDVKKSKAKVKRILAKKLSIKEAMSEDKEVVNN